jgi:hypothetical protein
MPSTGKTRMSSQYAKYETHVYHIEFIICSIRKCVYNVDFITHVKQNQRIFLRSSERVVVVPHCISMDVVRIPE